MPIRIGKRVVQIKRIYFASIFAGYPAQRFKVILDTGSGHLFVPSSMCNVETCVGHNKYNRLESTSVMDITHDNLELDEGNQVEVLLEYGTGEIQGPPVSEIVCIGEEFDGDVEHMSANCVRMRLIEAATMSNQPFKYFDFDGVLGLGLDSLAIHPEYHFFGQMLRSGKVDPIFSYYLSRKGSNEITFGGVSSARMAGPMTWIPVHQPELGFWALKVVSVRIGNVTEPFCDDGECTAILDTGTSNLGVPNTLNKDWILKTARSTPLGVSGEKLDCQTVPGPTITFEFVDGFTFDIDSEDYYRPKLSYIQTPGDDDGPGFSREICRASLMPLPPMPELGEKPFIWGEPVLQKFYTSYDTFNQKIGIAIAAKPTPRELTAFER